MNYISAIKSAIKAKAPVVGLPVPGSRPFPVRRDLLRDGLRGLLVTEASIQEPLLSNASRVLIVYATGDRVKARRVFYPHAKDVRETICDANKNWAESQRDKLAEKRARPAFSSPLEKKIYELKEAIKKHDSRYVSRHGWMMRQRPWNSEPYEFTPGERAAFLAWRNEKPIRRSFGKNYFLPMVNQTDGITIGRNPAKRIAEAAYNRFVWRPACERYSHLTTERRRDLKAQIAALTAQL